VTRVVFVPSSTLVTVALPLFVTVTVGACALAEAVEGVAAGAGVEEGVAGAGVDEDVAAEAVVDAAGAVVVELVVAAEMVVAGVDGAAAGVVAAEVAAEVVVAGALDGVARGGGGVGSAAAVPAGFEAPPVAPARLCRSCGRSLRASVRWLSAPSGLPAPMSAMPPSMSPIPFMLEGRSEPATSPISLPGSVRSETILPILKPMTFSF
jgi:hypothetical protein